jgi:hypothetical protein
MLDLSGKVFLLVIDAGTQMAQLAGPAHVTSPVCTEAMNGRSAKAALSPGTPGVTCMNLAGAGDENRTRTISLGICRTARRTGPDLRFDGSVSDRERPLFTGVNGPLMARNGVPDLGGPWPPAPPPSPR